MLSSDSTHLFTICLNHTIRVWSLTTGKLVVSKDLLDRPIRSQDPHTILSPATPSYLRLFKAEMMDHPILLTFSPHNEGQFKFWDVRGGLTEPLSLVDRFPDMTLRPPDPDPSGNTIWSLSGFELRPGSVDESTELWVLWRNNNFCQLYSLHFNLEDLPTAWEINWVRTRTSDSLGANAPDFVENDSRDATEKWMEFLFWPNRYPASVLKTSLNIYQELVRTKPSADGKGRPLQERLCASIAAGVNLRKYSDSQLDYSHFTLETDQQWRNYWRIAEAVNAKRRSPVSLAFDAYADMAWVLQSDQCCGIRECNDLELLRYNTNQSLQHLESIIRVRWPHRSGLTEDSQSAERMAQLLDIARGFSQSFSAELTRDCESALYSELLEEAEHPVPYRVYDFYERCRFGDAISNETYEKLSQGVEAVGGLETLGTELIPAILSLLPENVRGSHTALRPTIFGSNLVDAGLHDTITDGRQIVYNLFVLMIFLECEEIQDENRSEKFDAPSMFMIMLDILKEYEKKTWLLSHVRDVPLEFSKHSKHSPVERGLKSTKSAVQSSTQQVTLLRDTKGRDIKPQPAVASPQSYLLTEMLNDVEVWVGGASEISSDDGCVWIQCYLIAHGNIALASGFSQFQPNTPWSTYIKGRLSLARNEHEQAALYFQKAAYPLGELRCCLRGCSYADFRPAHGKAIGMLSEMSAGLLTMDDTDYFNSGVCRYFQHILALFESAEAYSLTAKFAHLALSALPHDRSGSAVEDQDGILSRLFGAELHCSHYVQAYTALTQLKDEQLRQNCATAWIDALLGRTRLPKLEATGSIRLLQELPLDLHPHIAQVLDDHLSSLAEKQASIPGIPGRIWSNENGIDYLKILYALRIGRQDYRGAVSVLMERLHLVKKSSQARNDTQATTLRHTLLALINALSCVAAEEAYVVAPVRERMANSRDVQRDSEGRDLETGWKTRRRITVTLEDLRREYQQLLDRCSRIERGDFDFDAGSEEEDEESGLEGVVGTNGVDAMEL